MGEFAEELISRYESGQIGMPIPFCRDFPKTTKEALKNQSFSIVETIAGNTSRMPGTVLIVCEQNDATYWVWASRGISGIAKHFCKIHSEGHTIHEALELLGRKSYGGK